MKTLLFLLLMLSLINANAQTYVDIPWHEGTVTINGETKEGMIRMGGGLHPLSLNHQKTYFVTTAEFEGAKKHPGNKIIKEYHPEDIQGYSTFAIDEAGNRVEFNFISGEVTYMDGLAKRTQTVFLRVNEIGPLSAYTFIPKAERESTPELQHQAEQNAVLQSILFLKKGDGPYLIAGKKQLSELLTECPEVINKINTGVYGFADLNDRPKKKGLMKTITAGASDNDLEQQILLAVGDYNRCVK